jgi:sRNA-binding regulator protein Hfq
MQEQRHSMKEILDSTPAKLTEEMDNFANRKLIRPALPRVDHNSAHSNGNHNSNHNANHNGVHLQVAEHRDRHERTERGDRGFERGGTGPGGGKKTAPPEQTNAENFYYQKQMQSRTPMVIVLQDGEEVHGIIEWYDKNCLKVTREDGNPNLMIYKPAIKYMFKEEERGR